MAIQHESQNAPRTLLVEARLQKGWSQRELADLLGTTYVNISRWERNQTRPNPYFRRKLCKLFGKTEEELDLDAAHEDEVEASAVTQNATVARPPTAPRPAQILDPRIPQRSIVQLVGRDEIFASLKERLCSDLTPEHALIALNGLPGVGKTTLSLALAHDEDIRKRFSGGILWAGLGPDANLTQHLSHWGTLLDVANNEAQDSRAWARALTKAIGDRSMLIVLDDVWHREDAFALKIGGPNCAHLITTRFPVLAYEIAPYGAILLSELNEQDGLNLLEHLAPRVVNQEPERAGQLVKAVGGLPLALTLMGKFLHVQSNTNQPRRIRATLERLNDVEQRMQLEELRGPNELHTSLPESETSLSLDSVITVTEQILDTETRNALYMLSIFPPKPDSFSEEAALAVMDASVEILDKLGDVGLLETSAAGRYMLHQTIADYANLRLTRQLAEAAYDHYLAYILNFITEHRKDYEKLEQETNVVLTAIDAAYSHSKTRELVQSVIAFAPYLLLRGFYESAEYYLQRALTTAQHSHDDYGIASTLLYLGEIAQKQGNYALAESRFKQGLDLARAINNPERISTLLNDLGWVTWKQGNYALAETYLQEGLTLARQIADDERISSILKTLGSVVGSQGNYTQEKQYLQEGLTLARRLKDDEQICILLINLGVTEGEQGDHAQAEKYFLEGLEIARKIGHREWVSALLSNLGGAADEQEHYEKAEEYFLEGLTVAKQIGHPEWTSLLLLNLGVTTRKQKKYLQASEYLQEGLVLSQQIDIPQMTSNALYELGNLYLDQQKVDEAESTFRKMIVATPEGGQDLLALAQYGLARSIAAKGNVEEAQLLGKTSLTMLEEMGHHRAQEVKNWLNVEA